MNKKLLSVAISSFMLLSMVDFSFAAKKDVSDPVLQQIISELSDRMPRFINKYGAAVFVEDEQITRGALLQALYEFDKKSSSSSSNVVSTSVSSSGVISKKDYDALNAKVAALEKKVKSGAGASSGGSSDVDIVQIMNDLEPNMPMMLDNSLSSSKVFRELEARVNAGGGKGSSSSSVSSVSQAAVTSLQRNVGELSVKVNNIEEVIAKGGGSKTNISSSVLKDIQKNINDLNAKYDSIESTLAKGSSVSSDSKTNISSSVLKDIQRNINDLNTKYNDIETTLAKSSKSGNSSSSSISQEEVNGLKKTLVQMQQSYVTLGKRVDSVEKEQSLLASSSSSNTSSSSLSDKQMRLITSKINSIREDVDNIKIDNSKISNSKSSADIKKIEKRLSNLENSEKSGNSGSGSGSSKTGTVAKVSLGLSLVAALFIAR